MLCSASLCGSCVVLFVLTGVICVPCLGLAGDRCLSALLCVCLIWLGDECYCLLGMLV